MDDDKRRERDEQDAYGELDVSEQTAIRFLLDCAIPRMGFEPVRYDGWLADGEQRPLAPCANACCV